MFKLSQKGSPRLVEAGIAHILLLILLLVGLVAGVYGVQYARTVLDPKAYDIQPASFVNAQGIALPAKVIDPNVYLLIRLPTNIFYLSQKHDGVIKSIRETESTPSSSEPPKFNPYPEEPVPLNRITIENVDDKGNILGESIRIVSNFEDYINKPIPWRLEELNSDEKQGLRSVLVTFEGGEYQSGYFASITLIRESLPLESEIPVQVFIDKDYPDVEIAKQWAQETVDSYLNEKYQTFNIHRKVKFETATIEEIQPSCKGVEKNVENMEANKIKLFISAKQFISYANPYTNWICLSAPELNVSDQNVALHEFGHIFGLPDYYLQDIRYWNNYVVPIGITSEVKDVMWHNEPFFHPNSVEIVNSNTNPLPGSFDSWVSYVPRQVVLHLTGDNGLPLVGAKIEVFPGVMTWLPGLTYPHFTIPNTVSYERVTDSTGRVFLGDQEYIFHHHNPAVEGFAGGSALLRITANGQIKYAVLTLSHLNNLFFQQNQKNFATISEPFSLLPGDPREGSDASNSATLKSFYKVSSDSAISEEGERDMAQHIYEQLKMSGRLND